MRALPNRWLHLLGVLALAIALAACGAGATRDSRPASGAPAGTPPAGPGAGTTIHVTARNFAFALDATQVSAGPVTFVVRNDSPAPHDFVLRGAGVNQGTPMLKAGETATFTVVLTPGTYTYICTVPGHDRLGMTGTLTVV